MKTTVLIYKEVDGVRQLVVATKKEWEAILEANKGLPTAERRLFEENTIKDGKEEDRMFIEVSYEDYQKWNREDTAKKKKRIYENKFEIISLDTTLVADPEDDSMHEALPSPFDLERFSSDRVLLEQLTAALKAWKPWAPELLQIYLDGKQHSCTLELCRKYNLKERAVRYRKAQFEEFVKNFLK